MDSCNMLLISTFQISVIVSNLQINFFLSAMKLFGLIAFVIKLYIESRQLFFILFIICMNDAY